MSVRIDITRADGTTSQVSCSRERITVGSGAAADVRIDGAAELAPLHLLLMPAADGCWVSCARSAAVKATVAGRPVESELLPWGTEIDIGSVCIRPRRADARGRFGKLGWWQLAIVAAGLAYLAADLLTGERSPPALPASDVPAPALFGNVPGGCASGGNPQYRAEEARDEAEGMRVRYEYEPGRGIEAVRAFTEAATCFRAAGDEASSDEMSREGARLRRRIEEDYRDLQMAHTKALQDRDLRGVLQLSQELHAYLATSRHPYRLWLERLIREITVELNRKPKEDGMFDLFNKASKKSPP